MNFKDITSHQIACKVLKRNPAMPNVSKRPKKQQAAIIADAQLMDIADAINFVDGKFKPNYKDTSQEKWYPVFDASQGFAFSRSYCDYWFTDTVVGSRLCYRFRSEEAADFFGKHFNALHKKALNVK